MLLSLALLLGLYLIVSFGEYAFRFGQTTRTLLFWGFVLVLTGVIYQWVIKPLLKIWQLRKSIGEKEAAVIIGNHFKEIEDRLLNLLQLESAAGNHTSSSLLLASIEQKTKKLSPIPFDKAINIAVSNKKWIRLASIPLLLILGTLLIQSSIITDSTKRIIAFNKDFPIPPPFSFNLKNKTLSYFEGDHVVIEMETKGKAIPNEAYTLLNGQKLKMTNDSSGHFSFIIENIQQSMNLQFEAAGFKSKIYPLKTNNLPSLINYSVALSYPSYTGKKNEKLASTGEITVPEGTRINWNILAKDADQVLINKAAVKPNKKGAVSVSQIAKINATYLIQLKNKLGFGRDSARLNVNVIIDGPPNIQVEAIEDSSKLLQYFFLGTAGDDYKVTRVNFAYRFSKTANPNKKSMGSMKVPLKISAGSEVGFVHGLNLGSIGVLPGEEITYYLEAWDNNGIRGSQVTQTTPQVLRRKTAEEVRKDAHENSDFIKNSMAGAMKKANELRKQNKDIDDQLNQSKSMKWQQQNKLEEFLKEQEELNKKLDKIKQNNQKLQEQNKDFMQPENELEERQENLNKALNELKNPELDKLLEEIRKLLEQNAPKEEIQKRMKQLQKQNQELLKNMDALREQFKQLQMERMLEDQIQQLDELKQEQEKLKENTEGKKEKTEELAKKQELAKKKLEELQSELKKVDELNDELEKPMDIDMGKEEGDDAGESMDNAKEELVKGKEKKAGKEQEEAIDKLKKMSDKLKASLKKAREEQMAEDYASTRELLDNLIHTSHEQEVIFTELNTMQEYGPRFVVLNTEQMKVREKCAVLEDSLRALAKRQPMVSTFITREMNRINMSMDDALQHLKDRNLRGAGLEEQYVMTGLNNLAVMLMESMQDMQAKMNKGKGKGKGKSKGQGKGGGEGEGQGKSGGKGNGKLSEGQKQLGEMMQKLQQEGGGKKGEQGEKGAGGQKPGGSQPGGKAGQGGAGSGSMNSDKAGSRLINKEYAQMALMQEALRRKIAEMKKELLRQGKVNDARNLQKAEDLMEINEREVVNKTINKNTIIRQKEIQTRLLEHEKAQLSQKQDDKRQSEKPPETTIAIPAELQKKVEEQKNQRELLRKTSPQMGDYYKQKTEEYLQQIR